MSSVQGGFAMTGAFAAGLLSQAPFTYTAVAVWRYFLVAHQRYFGEFFLVNQILTRNPTLSASCKPQVIDFLLGAFIFLLCKILLLVLPRDGVCQVWGPQKTGPGRGKGHRSCSPTCPAVAFPPPVAMTDKVAVR